MEHLAEEESWPEVKLSLDSIIESLVQGVIITDSDNHIQRVNPAFCRMTGYLSQEVLGKSPSFLKSGYHDDAFYEEMWTSLNDRGSWEGEIWNRKKNGELYLEWLAISAIQNQVGQRQNYIAIFSDVTQKKIDEERMTYLAHHDPLTGIANRILFRDRCRQEMSRAKRRGQKVAFLFGDLDKFKPINDKHGHAVGDLVLRSVAETLKACLRDEDTVARLGGDEFGMVMGGNISKENIHHVVRRIQNQFAKPFEILSERIHAEISLGASFYPDDGDDMDTLMAKADQAMYRAKRDPDEGFYMYDGPEEIS